MAARASKMAPRTVRFSNTSKTDDGEAAKQYELFFARVFGCLPRQGQYKKNITTPEAKLLIDRQRRGFIWHKQKFNLQYSPPISPQNSWQQIHPSFQLDVMKRTADFFVRFDQAIARWKKVGGKPKPVPIRNLGGGFGFKLSLNDPPSIECVQSIRTCLRLSDHCQWFAELDEMAAYQVKQVNAVLDAYKTHTVIGTQLSYDTDDYDSFPDETSSESSSEDDWETSSDEEEAGQGVGHYTNYVNPLDRESKSPAKTAAATAAQVASLANRVASTAFGESSIAALDAAAFEFGDSLSEDDWGRHDYDNYVSPLESESKSPVKTAAEAAAEAAAVARRAATNYQYSFVWRSLLYNMPPPLPYFPTF